MWASISFVVVFPFDPETLRNRAGWAARNIEARSPRAARASATRTCGPEPGSNSSTRAAAAPRANASRTNAWPSYVGPRKATKRSPSRIVRVSVETPRTVTPSIHPPAVPPTALRTRVRSSMGVCLLAGLRPRALLEDLLRHLAIVERLRLAPDDLVVLVALPRDQHDVVAARHPERDLDRGPPVGLDEVTRLV